LSKVKRIGDSELRGLIGCERISLVINFKILPQEAVDIIRSCATAGLLAVTALVVNLSYKGFSTIFKEKTRTFWGLFFFASIIFLLLFLYAFSLLFER
jgi:hypothetical protein